MESWLLPGEVLQDQLQLLLVNFSSYDYRTYLFPTTSMVAGNNTYVPEVPCLQFLGAKVANKPLSNKYWGSLLSSLTAASDHRRAGIEADSHFPPSFKASALWQKDFQGTFKDQNISLPSVFCFSFLGEPNIKKQLYAQRKLKVICLGRGTGLERSENNLNGCLKLKFIFNT